MRSTPRECSEAMVHQLTLGLCSRFCFSPALRSSSRKCAVYPTPPLALQRAQCGSACFLKPPHSTKQEQFWFLLPQQSQFLSDAMALPFPQLICSHISHSSQLCPCDSKVRELRFVSSGWGIAAQGMREKPTHHEHI